MFWLDFCNLSVILSTFYSFFESLPSRLKTCVLHMLKENISVSKHDCIKADVSI